MQFPKRSIIHCPERRASHKWEILADISNSWKGSLMRLLYAEELYERKELPNIEEGDLKTGIEELLKEWGSPEDPVQTRIGETWDELSAQSESSHFSWAIDTPYPKATKRILTSEDSIPRILRAIYLEPIMSGKTVVHIPDRSDFSLERLPAEFPYKVRIWYLK